MSSKYPVLSEALTKRYALPEADADKFVAQMFDVLLKAVEQEGVVKVKGLGTFKLTPVGARESVDVNTGERIVIDSRNKITFVPDVVLRDRVNSPFAQFETVVLNDGVEFSSLDEKPEVEEEAEENDENETAEENEAAEEEETADEEEEAPAEDKAPAEGSIKDEAPAEDKAPADGSIKEEAPAEDKAPAEGSIKNEAPAEDKAPAEGFIKDEAPAEDKAPAEGSIKEEAPTPIHVVADKLTDASDKLTSASSKLSDVSDKLSSASERLSDSSKQLSTASSQAADGSGNKQLRDALSIANDLRKQVFDMKQQSFVYTNENRKLKNANFVLTKRVRRMRLWLWVLALCVVMLLATIGAGCFYLASEPTPIMLQERSAFEPEQDSLAATKDQTAPTDASQASSPQASSPQGSTSQGTAPQGSTLSKPANAPSAAAPQASTPQGSSNAPSEPKPAKPAANRPAPAAKPSAAAHGPSAQPKGSRQATAQTSSYDSDPRVRTGAYRITGVAQVVVARRGQTLASISRAHLGEGMECYVEALNGKEVTEGTKVKIPKLELKKKSKRN